jgi:hypothetical protein
MDLIREYFDIDQSDSVGVSLARALWRQMTPQQQAEARRLHREPCRGYDESCRPTKETR